MGPTPQLPPPVHTPFPTVKVASVVGWRNGAKPVCQLPAAGLRVDAFATGLDHPRWLYVLPNGDVLVAETNSPHYGGDAAGIKGFVAGLIMSKAGAGVTSPNRIS